jgi:hypothetical protein
MVLSCFNCMNPREEFTGDIVKIKCILCNEEIIHKKSCSINYCCNCKCRRYFCKKIKRDNYLNCERHKCKICENDIDPYIETIYCLAHRCSVKLSDDKTFCSEPRIDDYKCKRHTCQFENCDNVTKFYIIEPTWCGTIEEIIYLTYCKYHNCVIHTCNNLRSKDSFVCEDHVKEYAI